MALLDNVRVLDLTDERGLLAGRLLADLGADVVALEPPGGNPARRVSPHPLGPDGARRPDASYVWEAYGANRRGVVADRGTDAGRDLVRRLIGAADIVLDTATPPYPEDGLRPEDLLAEDPGLIYVSITPFGRTGPKATYTASDLVLWAAGGPLDEHRDGDRPPVRISLPQAYRHASADAAGGSLLALHARQATGRGQLVDVSVQASLGTATLGRVLAHAVGHVDRGAPGAGLALPVARPGGRSAGAPSKWPCRDGLIELHIGIGPATGAFTANLIAWVVSEDGSAKRFADVDWRDLPRLVDAGTFTGEDGAELVAMVGRFLAAKTKAEVLDAALRWKLLCVPVYDTGDVRRSEQLAARDFWVDVGDGIRRRVLPGPIARSSIPTFSITRPAPDLGEHSAEVAREWATPRRPTPGPAAPVDAGSNPRSDGVGALDGLKVADFSWVVAGPLIGRALADFGATVVRIESSRRIETARFMPPFIGGTVSPEHSALYATCNAGKLGLTLDLSSPAGRDVARDLVRWADVVIESFAPGQMRRWGLDYESVRPDRPDLIMLSTSINGQTGPVARLAGYGNIGAALAGFQAVVGWPDRPPLGPFGPYTDYLGPRLSLAVLLAALDHARRTGEGCYLDVSQVEAGSWFQAPELLDYDDTGTLVERRGNRDRDLVPHGVFPTIREEGAERSRYVAIAATTDAGWRALAEEIGRPDLAADPDLSTAVGRRRREDEIEGAITAWTAGRTAADVEGRLQARGVAAHGSASSRDFCTDPQLAHRGHLVTLPHDRFGSVSVEGPRYLLSETPGRVRRPAPTFGEHNRLVLGSLLGYSEPRIAELAAAGTLV